MSNFLKIFIIIFGLAFISGLIFLAQKNSQAAISNSPDAQVVRVINNENHYSLMTWYRQKDYKGNPKPLKVDGYEAIQDGHVVYIGGANAVDTDDEDNNPDTLYTNIYAIAFNLGADAESTEIFNRLVKNFKLNTNLKINGTCTIDSTSCLIDSDCRPSKCIKDNPKETQGICQINGKDVSGATCDGDWDCNNYCDSQKAKVTRDTKRLADLADINLALENYSTANSNVCSNEHSRHCTADNAGTVCGVDKNSNPYDCLTKIYPSLTAGTYLPNNTLSIWPSWQETLQPILAKYSNLKKLPLDPINKFTCGTQDDPYNPTTCWDDKNKKFVDTNSDAEVDLENTDFVYHYKNPTNNSFNLCAVFESGYTITPNAPAITSGVGCYTQ